MGFGGPRKTAPGVKNGRVKKKNRHERTPNYWNTRQPELVVDRERPGRGYWHLLRKSDVVRFVGLLPDWEELVVGLDAIVLAHGSSRLDGFYRDGVIAISAWDREMAQVWTVEGADEHSDVLDLVGVKREPHERGVLCTFSVDSARAFQLCHVFLHELGHHVDNMSSKGTCPDRGEPFAEAYAVRRGGAIWTRYCDTFGCP